MANLWSKRSDPASRAVSDKRQFVNSGTFSFPKSPLFKQDMSYGGVHLGGASQHGPGSRPAQAGSHHGQDVASRILLHDQVNGRGCYVSSLCQRHKWTKSWTKVNVLGERLPCAGKEGQFQICTQFAKLPFVKEYVCIVERSFRNSESIKVTGQTLIVSGKNKNEYAVNTQIYRQINAQLSLSALTYPIFGNQDNSCLS